MKSEKATIPDSYTAEYDGFADDWISTSALSALMMCGMSFYYKYILRWREPISVRMCAGSGAHKGREINLQQKITSLEDVPLDVVTDATRDDVVGRFEKNDYCATKEFEGKSKSHARDIATDLAVEFVTKDYSAFQVDLTPASVEESIAVQFEGLPRVIVGKIDLREEDCSIVDLKTGKQAFGQSKTDNSMALSTYGLLTLAEHGVLPPNYRIQNVSRGKTGCKANLYETERTMEDIRRQLMRFTAGMKAIEAGNFVPCDSGHWKCSPGFCGFYSRCPYGCGDISKEG